MAEAALPVSETKYIRRWRQARDPDETGMPDLPLEGDAFLDLGQCHQFGVVQIFNGKIWTAAPLPTFVTGRDYNELKEQK